MIPKVEVRGNRLAFFCPGCEKEHEIFVAPGRWAWNGNLERPTFSPSVLCISGHYVDARPSAKCWCTYAQEHPDEVVYFRCGRCHSFVTDGRIQFLRDCSHALAGQTVDLPEWKAA